MERDVPRFDVDLALLLDTSTSMREELASVQDAAAVFLEELPHGRVRGLVTLDGVVNRRRVSGDPRELLASMIASARGGLTVLFDALDDAISALSRSRSRKVIVLWTDGEDLGSAASFNEVYGALKGSDVLVYVISYANHLRRLRPGNSERYVERAKGHLGSFVSVSGGLLFDASDGGGREAFRKIASDLGSQYLLGFAPAAASSDDYRSLRIRARRDGVKLRYRPSYRAPSHPR